MLFKMKSGVGSHAEPGPDGRVVIHKAGDNAIIESDRDLVTMFPNKFERVDEINPAKPEKSDVQKAAEEGFKGVMPPADPPAEQEEEEPLGRDVTHRFPLAEEEDFKVFAKGGAFFVVEADDPDVPLNDKPLKRKDVEQFVEQNLEM